MTTTISYPSSLPIPLLRNLSGQMPSGVIRSETDVGPSKVRRRTSANVTPLEATVICTRDQFFELDEFFNNTTKSGALAFIMTRPIRGGDAEFRFTKPPTYRPLTPRSDPSMKLEVDFSLEQLPPAGGIAFVEEPGCVSLSGSTGTVMFAEDSTISAEFWSGIYDPDNPDASGALIRKTTTGALTFDYAGVTTSGGQNVSVSWEYVNASQTSTITFHKDDGWSYSLNAAHQPADATPAASGTEVQIRKNAGDESEFPGFRDLSNAPLDSSNNAFLCQSGAATIPVALFDTVASAVLDNSDCGTPPSRFQGFNDHVWACQAPDTGALQGDYEPVIPEA